MATTLESFIKEGTNVLLIQALNNKGVNNHNNLWCVDFSKFTHPLSGMLNAKTTVLAGNPVHDSSLYAKAGFTRTLNPCYMVRKALYKLLNAAINSELGYCYYKKDTREIWCSYFDGSMDETNKILAGEKIDNKRFINLYINDGNIKGGSVKNDILPHQKLVYGKDGHSIASYFYGMLLYAHLIDDGQFDKDTKKDLDQIIDSFADRTLNEKEKQEILTKFENDFLINLANVNQLSSAIMKQDDIRTVGIANGEKLFDGESPFEETKTPSSKKPTVSKRLDTVGDAIKEGIYKIKHTFSGDENLVPESFNDMALTPQVEEVCAYIKSLEVSPMNMNFMFTGEAGTGKSTAAQMIAAICGLPYRFITCSSSTEETELKTQTIIDPNDGSRFVNVDSEVINAIRYGGIIEVQEINMIRREGVAACLNSVLDGIGKIKLLDGSMLERHPHCVFIFTMNVGYEGSKNLNQALLSRCFCKEEFVLPSEEELVNRLLKKQGLTKELAEKMVKVFFEVRNCLEVSGETNGVCSYRELDAWGEMLSRNYVICQKIAGFPKMTEFKAAEKSLVSHATEDKDLQAELCAVISKTFPAFDY